MAVALGSLQAQDTGQGLDDTLFADDAGLIGVQHGIEVFLGIVEEQEHIAAGVDGGGQHVNTLHAVGHTDHVGSIGDDHAVEAQLVTQQAGHDLLAQSTGHDGIGSDVRVDFLHVFGHQDVTAHDGIQAAVDQGLINVAVGSHPLVMGKVVNVVGHMGITVVLAVAGEVLGAAVNTLGLMQTIHISLTHGGNQFVVIAVGTGQNLFALPVIGNVDNRSKRHVAAGGLDLGTGDTAHSLCILGLSGSTDLHLGRNEGTIRADTIAALLGVTCNKDRNLCVLLQQAVLVQNHLTGHTIVAAAAQVVFLHQFLQILLGVACGELPEQLAYLLFVGHGSDGVFDPCDILIGQVIGLCS